MTPAYLELGVEVLRERTERAVAALSDCRLCPRDCGVDRLAGKWSACKTGRWAIVSSAFPHFGEEDCLRGWNGSGTVFFAHCNLRCVFCQNFDISQGVRPGTEERGGARGSRPEEIAEMMLRLQDRGCHNINWVTPEHVVPQALEALVMAVEGGLELPLVYNTSAYDSVDTLELLDGIVDVYMPDFKLFSPEAGGRYLKAEDYGATARAAIAEMHRQVGPLRTGPDGLARRGVLVRHLVMPGLLDETASILGWLAELHPDSYVNVMGQYRPEGAVGGGAFPELDRRPGAEEVAEAVRLARELGLRVDERRPHPRLRPMLRI